MVLSLVGPKYTTNSMGWYRREFTLPAEDKGKRIWVEFGRCVS